MNTIKEKIKNYILEELTSEFEADDIRNDTPLLSGGIIDSISALQLVEFIEQTYGFQFQAHEVDQDNLNTLDLIEHFIRSKVQV